MAMLKKALKTTLVDIKYLCTKNADHFNVVH